MIVGNTRELQAKVIESDLVKDVSMKVLVSPKEGWEGHVMRVFDVEAGGHTPKHSHPWPHINYVISGTGQVMIDGNIHELSAGSYAYVPSDTIHQFQNTSDDTLSFICIVPEEGHK
jgi:quercetin dioxygenase-like cupin family protein